MHILTKVEEQSALAPAPAVGDGAVLEGLVSGSELNVKC